MQSSLRSSLRGRKRMRLRALLSAALTLVLGVAMLTPMQAAGAGETASAPTPRSEALDYRIHLAHRVIRAEGHR